MQSFRALMVAIVIHAVILGSFLWLQKPQESKRVYNEPRILLSLRNPYVASPSVQTVTDSPSTEVLQPKSKNKPINEAKSSVPKAQIQETPAPLSEELAEPSDRIQRLIDRHYGELFDELSPAEKNYIIHNILTIHRIDRKIGNALLADKPRDTFQDGESNFVEMYLHPDGTLSDITIISEGKNAALDQLTMETVERSYASYPRPNQTTLIRLHTRIFKSK